MEKTKAYKEVYMPATAIHKKDGVYNSLRKLFMQSYLMKSQNKLKGKKWIRLNEHDFVVPDQKIILSDKRQGKMVRVTETLFPKLFCSTKYKASNPFLDKIGNNFVAVDIDISFAHNHCFMNTSGYKTFNPAAGANALSFYFEDNPQEVASRLFTGLKKDSDNQYIFEEISKELGTEVSDNVVSLIAMAMHILGENSLDVAKKHIFECKGADTLYAYLLDTDKRRMNLNSYEKAMLTDPTQGIWDLWDCKANASIKGYTSVALKEPIYGRNPEADINDGIVGIDFGTKSTVVAIQKNGEKTRLLRIGATGFDKTEEEKDYENPTVLEFCNIKNFLEKYRMGSRPETSWNDLTVSHNAAQKMSDTVTSYYSYMYDVKQWCNSKNEYDIKMKDIAKNDFDIKPYSKLTDSDIDPVEIYAYYLGLYINNMRNGIFLKYLISYPVAYPEDVKNRIVQSFERGIKKSFPKTIAENKDIMSRFSIKAGTSEPAAYAVMALEMYKAELEDDEIIYYGIYDFGGGTTDFDFGQWRYSTEEESDEGIDYVINHYGDDGVDNLGGENLIELLAYETLKDNRERLVKDNRYKYSFAVPVLGKHFDGDEMLTGRSQLAKRNLKTIAEIIRPFWEGGTISPDNTEESDLTDDMSMHSDSNGSVIDKSVKLYPRDGGDSEQVTITFDLEKLRSILVEQIRGGVNNFFSAYKHAFDNKRAGSGTFNPEKLHIFLAGKSSQSPILKECFDKWFADHKLSDEDITDKFEIYPPLGTAEADAKLGKSSGSGMKVTGKTGVAFGLIECRDSGRIRVVNDRNTTQSARFEYCIGKARRNTFIHITDKSIVYGQWYKYLKASRTEVELYYSSLAESANDTLDISQEEIRHTNLSQDIVRPDSCFVYRAIDTDTIEYAVAESAESAQNGSLLYGPIQVKLK